MLVFLPGIGEISRTADLLAASVPADVDVRLLAGALPAEEQDLALAPSPPGRRRVVLATDIAETSLTVDGVRVVVDGGLARAPRHDTGTGMTRLVTVAISRASADQRAGRAGRTEPGVGYRLWCKIEHGTRPAHRTAEILEVDLAGLALELAAWGTPPGALRFVDPPPTRTWRAALELLTLLGAIEPGATPSGRRASPTSDGRWFRSRCTRGWRASSPAPRSPRRVWSPPSSTSATCCAAGPTRSRPTSPSAWRSCAGTRSDDRADRPRCVGCATAPPTSPGASAAGSTSTRSTRTAPGCCCSPASRTGSPAAAGHGQFQLRTGAGAWVADDDPLASAPFLVAADLDGKRSRSRIRLGAAVEAYEIAGVLDDVTEHVRLEWDGDRDDLVVRVERRLDALPSRRGAAPAGTGRRDDGGARRPGARRRGSPRSTGRRPPCRCAPASACCGRRSATSGPTSPTASCCARSTTGWRRTSRAPRRSVTSPASTWRRSCGAACRGRSARRLDELAPPSWTLPNGRAVPIDYAADRPTAAVRVQDVFGIRAHPSVAGGRVPLTLALLSPADRPLQVTADLPGFWAGTWADVRKELAGRYPKHRWPADPANEPPGRQRPR